MTEEENKPAPVKFYRIVPQMKTFKPGALLKSKVDLYYSLRENIVETGADDGWCPLSSGGSFSSNSEFISKDSTLFFVEAAQFRADDGNVYVRAQLLVHEKVVWINILACPNNVWAFKIRNEQKQMIKTKIKEMFDIIVDSDLEQSKKGDQA